MAKDHLSGSLLANDLYFVLHNDRTGRMRLHPRVTGLGLAGAVLGELMLAGHITAGIAAGEVRLALVNTHPTGDPVTQKALDHIIAEPSHSFRTWLQFLGQSAPADVGSRMIQAGLLHPPARRSWLRAAPPPTPVDPNTAMWPIGRLNLAVERREPLNEQDNVLLGLVSAAGGARVVLWDQDPDYLAHATAALPVHLRELVAQTEAAVGDAVISRR
ncbi:GPP34 family phosphoprotein [Sinosporangium siamense]|uniref:GOLPH3/VPS74 family protein n=1 Tax=Sinosporangium siamense TaxID=1367973 RepID=UPI0023B290A1